MMIKCPECGKEISDSAKSCPFCGYKKPVSFNTKALIVGVISIIAIFLLIKASQYVAQKDAERIAGTENNNIDVYEIQIKKK